MPILGIVAAAGGFTKFGDFYQIATSTATGGAVSNITFSSIPQDYTHLQIRGIHRSASTDGSIDFQLNSDTGSNYARHSITGDGATASSSASVNATHAGFGGSASSTAGSNIFGSFVLDIFDYTNTNKFKTTRSIGGIDNNGSGAVNLRSNLWRSTSAITSIKIYNASSGNSLAQYSSFALYGIKAS